MWLRRVLHGLISAHSLSFWKHCEAFYGYKHSLDSQLVRIETLSRQSAVAIVYLGYLL